MIIINCRKFSRRTGICGLADVIINRSHSFKFENGLRNFAMPIFHRWKKGLLFLEKNVFLYVFYSADNKKCRKRCGPLNLCYREKPSLVNMLLI